jgi:hypothetical protein
VGHRLKAACKALCDLHVEGGVSSCTRIFKHPDGTNGDGRVRQIRPCCVGNRRAASLSRSGAEERARGIQVQYAKLFLAYLYEALTESVQSSPTPVAIPL